MPILPAHEDNRVAAIPPSCVHEVHREVGEWERRTGREAIRLHVGEPNFGPPPSAVEALVAAARDGRTGYTSAEGMLRLREALTAKLESRNGHSTNPDLVFVTPGSTQGLVALMQSTANPGDEVLLPSVHWPVYLQQVLVAGLRPVFYPLDEFFRPDLAALAELGSARTRLLLVNSPANPTGAICDAQLLTGLLDLARHRGWQVISDEAYEDFAFDAEHVSMASLERELPAEQRRVFSAFSFSKSHGMTGYRLGYVVAPHQRGADAFRNVQEASILGPSTPVQYAGLAAVDAGPPEHNRERMRAARDVVLGPLGGIGLLTVIPEGGWYALLDVTPTGLDADGFAAALLTQHAVSVAPAKGFALRPDLTDDGWVRSVGVDPVADRYVRLAYCGDPQAVRAGVREIVAFARTRGQ